MNTRKLGAIAGITGPVAFVAVFTIAGWLRPGYDARAMFVSELALGPGGIVQTVNFFAYGLATLLFALGMGAEFPAARAAVPALRVIGFGLIGAGVFVMDPLTTPLRSLSWHGILHGVFGAPVFYGMPLGCFLFARHFRGTPRWRSLAGYTLATGVATLLLAVAGRIVVELDRSGGARNLWGGTLQRAHMMVYGTWQITVAARLARTPAIVATLA